MSYKNLNLDKTLIPTLAANALPGAAVGSLVQNGKVHECLISMDGKQAMLHFYFNNDGTTTIHWKVGKHQDISEIVARYIAEHGVSNSQPSFILVLKNRQQSEVDLLLEYLKEDAGASLVKEEAVDSPKHKAYWLQSQHSDKITIKYYATGTLQLQGKPLFLYRESISFLTQFLSLEDVIKSQTETFHVNVDPAQVADELAAVLRNAHPFLGSVVVKILSAAITLRKINVNLDDYSSFVFPVLRGLEGYLKLLFASKGIHLPKVSSFGDLFRLNSTGSSYILTPEERGRIKCSETCDAIQRCYSLYKRHRHGLFHVDEVVEATRIISSREEALELIETVLTEIETTYIPIARKKAKA